MSEDPDLFSPGSLEALGANADELRMVVATTVGRAVEEAVRRVEVAASADNARLLEKVEALEATVAAEAAARSLQTDELRQALAVAVTHAVAKVDQAHRADDERILERIDALEEPLPRGAEQRHSQADEVVQALGAAVERAVAQVQDAASRSTTGLLERLTSLDAARVADAVELRATLEQAITHIEESRAGDAEAVERSLAQLQAARSADAGRLLEQMATLAEAVTREVDSREAQADQTSAGLAAAVERAVADLDVLLTADANRLLEKVDAIEASLTVDTEARSSQTDELRQALAVAVTHAVAKVDQAHRAGDEHILERIDALEELLQREAEQHRNRADELVQAVAAAAERALTQAHDAASRNANGMLERLTSLDAARTTEAERLLEALEVLSREADARTAQLDDVRLTVATTLGQAVTRIETSCSADAAMLVEHVTALAARIQGEAERREQQAAAMLTTVDERLQALHRAGAQASEEQEGRLVGRVEAVTAEHGRALVLHIDERTAAIADPEVIPMRLAAEVQGATAAALTAQVEPLVGRLVEATDTLAHEGGRIEAMARGHAGEVREVEERVAALFTEVAERAEAAVDRSRARISEGQVALGARIESIMGEMLSAVSAATERLEARLTESAEGIRAAGGHQNAALLDAVKRSGQQLVALGDRVGENVSSLTALEDLRTSQAILREGVQDGAQKAELALVDIRSLRERLAPHLAALADATTRRADADQAGFDAVLARLDQLLAASQR